MAVPSVARLAAQCFRELDEEVGRGVTVEHMSRLGLLLGRNWAKALAVVDAGEVECLRGEPSGRLAFQVRGRSGVYLTLPSSYCSCQAHHYEVAVKAEAPFCKHQLAAQLASTLRRCSVTPVPDATLARFLMDAR